MPDPIYSPVRKAAMTPGTHRAGVGSDEQNHGKEDDS